MTGRRILAIPGVLALVFATTLGVGIMPASAHGRGDPPPPPPPKHQECPPPPGHEYGPPPKHPEYPPPVFPPGRHCGFVNGFPRGDKGNR